MKKKTKKTPDKPKLRNTVQPASVLQKGQGHQGQRQPEDMSQIRKDPRQQDTETHGALIWILGQRRDNCEI